MGAHTILWWAHLPTDIIEELILWTNPIGQATKRGLELTNSVFHHTCMSYTYDEWERTTLTRTNNKSYVEIDIKLVLGKKFLKTVFRHLPSSDRQFSIPQLLDAESGPMGYQRRSFSGSAPQALDLS